MQILTKCLALLAADWPAQVCICFEILIWRLFFRQMIIIRKNCMMDRFGSDPAVAVLTWASIRLVQRRLHHLGGHQRRIQTHRSRWSGQTLGWTQIQTQHELRQTQPRFTVCLYFIVYLVYKARYTRTSSSPLWSGLIYNCHPSYSIHLPTIFLFKRGTG